MYYVWTRHGRLLRVDARSAQAAQRSVESDKRWGPVLQVETQAAYDARNKPDPAYCRNCGDLKAICGNWCRVGGMP